MLPKLLPLLFSLFFLFRSSSLAESGLFLLAVLIHEAGHLVALLFFGYGLPALSLSSGGVSLIPRTNLIPYKKEIPIFLSGPAAGLAAMGITLFFIRRNMTYPLLYFFFCNTLLFLLNLFPVKGLDGYFALKSFLLQRKEPEQAELLLERFDTAAFLVLMLFGILLFLFLGNASLILLVLILSMEKNKKSYE